MAIPVASVRRYSPEIRFNDRPERVAFPPLLDQPESRRSNRLLARSVKRRYAPLLVFSVEVERSIVPVIRSRVRNGRATEVRRLLDNGTR